MNLEPRVKFNASINDSGDIVPGTAIAGYRLPTAGGDYAYLLESAEGVHEIGVNKPTNSSGLQRVPSYDFSSAVHASGTTGLTCTLIAASVSHASASGTQYGGLPNPPQANMLESVAVGPGAVANNSSTFGANMGSAFGANANSTDKGATAVGGDSSAKRNGTALGYRARATQPAEIVLGHSGNSHIAFLPIRCAADASAPGVYPFSAVEGFNTLDEILQFSPSDAQRCDVRVQGTILVMSDADDQTKRKTFDVDYYVNYTYGNNWPASVLAQAFAVLHAGSNAPNVSITLDASTKMPHLTVATGIGSLTCVGLLTITKLVL